MSMKVLLQSDFQKRNMILENMYPYKTGVNSIRHDDAQTDMHREIEFLGVE